MRTHRVVGSTFFLAGAVLFIAGATAHSAPAFLRRVPIAPEVLIPFILWQLATWAILFGWFFLRPRHGRARTHDRAMPRV